MNFFKTLVFLITATLLITSCLPDKFENQMKESIQEMTTQVGDQHFKSAIALIELHNIRFGEYPKSLDSLKYIGITDKSIFSFVKYTKLDSGYSLDLTTKNNSKNKTTDYPAEFWNGLGLRKSNLKN